MIARIVGPIRAALLVPAALALVVYPAAHQKPRPAPPTPAYSPPPSEPSPFSTADAFCVPDTNRFDTVAPTDPALQAQPAQVVWLVAPAARGEAPDESGVIAAFGQLVDRCGGIGGRPLDVHVARETGDPVADCATAVDRFHPVMVVATGLPAAWPCIVRDRRTILVTGADVSNADLTGSGGRLVAAGSNEGVVRARLLALAGSGRLDGHKVAIVPGGGSVGIALQADARGVFAARRIRPVALGASDAVLTSSLDLSTVRSLEAETAPTAAHPLDVYSVGSAGADLPDALLAQPAAAAGRLARTVHLFAFSLPTDAAYRSSESPNTFSDMCNRALVDQPRPHGGTTTTTTQPQPPLAASFLTTADVCLLSRVVARALYASGPTLDPRAVVTALHRLPFVDQAAPGGTPKPRPNQVVNEPVRRIEQTIVLEEVQSTCPSAATSSTTTPTTSAAPAQLCWRPASGWDGGGSVVNVPLAATPTVVSH